MRKIHKNHESEDDIFEESGTEVVITSMIDYFDQINQLEDSEPKDKRSKDYKAWLKRLNTKIKEANQLAGYKVYKTKI